MPASHLLSRWGFHGIRWDERLALQTPVAWAGQRRLGGCFCVMETFLALTKGTATVPCLSHRSCFWFWPLLTLWSLGKRTRRHSLSRKTRVSGEGRVQWALAGVRPACAILLACPWRADSSVSCVRLSQRFAQWSMSAVCRFSGSPPIWQLLFWCNLLFSQILAYKKTPSSCQLVHNFLYSYAESLLKTVWRALVGQTKCLSHSVPCLCFGRELMLSEECKDGASI